MHRDDANREPKEKVSLHQLAYCTETLANLLYLIEHHSASPETVLHLTGIGKECIAPLEDFVRQSFE